MVSTFVDDRNGEPPVRGFLHEPERGWRDALALTHGAGGDCRSSLLVSLAETLAAAGVAVLRFDLPFRQRRPHGPPSPASATGDQDGIRRVIALLRMRGAGRVFAGGQSYGGRQTTMLAARESSPIDGLLLLSYPLHPPGQPSRLRIAHLGALHQPSLFVSGTRDPFGSVEELTAAIALVPGRTELVTIPDAAHGLLTKKNRDTLPAVIAQDFLRFHQKR
jgi:predicted alpha/beta-hydrolase family hydrolase